MNDTDLKGILQRYLQAGRDVVVWKLEGLTEYDVRRPVVPTGTNLLGIVKHLAGVELGYFGDVFGRHPDDSLPWFEEGAEANADMWATADESREDILGLYGRAWAHADKTIAELSLDSPGQVPWWGAGAETTLQRVLVHVIAETHRHAGQADIVRERLDGTAGVREGNSNMPDEDRSWWEAYCWKLEQAARARQMRATGKSHW
jgi:uncharacterized damage-inducible protein DinB